MERRLAAILAADIVGYSRLMEADEEATLSTLKVYREVIEGLVADHRGRVFGSALTAIGCGNTDQRRGAVQRERSAVLRDAQLHLPIVE